MPKSKGARLSLTLPGPLDGDSQKRAGPGSGDSAPGSTMVSPRTIQDVGGASSFATTPPKQKFPVDLPQEPQSPAITSLPPLPQSPKHTRENSRSLFSNMRAAKSSTRVPGPELSVRTGREDVGIDNIPRPPYGAQRAASAADSREGSISTSERTLVSSSTNAETLRARSATPSSGFRDEEAPPPPERPAPVPSYNSRSLPRNIPSAPQTPSTKKGHMFGFMRKTTALQSEEHESPHVHYDIPSSAQHRQDTSRENAPVAFNPLAANDPKHVLTSSRSGFLKVLKTGTNKAVSGYKKGKDKFLKGSQRTATGTAPPQRQQVPDPDYEMQIFGRPLLDQVRLTRIAPRLEQSRDKTEFWLPSLPWRCIDYLNLNGVEEEGIYRHSGSQLQINFYKQKFDRERDVDLFDEPELFDVNTVSSLLKAWFRDMPDELFPNALQDELIAKHSGTSGAPDALKEMISHLEPWRYYLLFAITCHLSLIASACDKNKMTIDNLHTCIGRSLRIERLVFTWLVGDWRNCWTNCVKEKEYLDAEYAWLEDETAQLDGNSSNPPSRQQEAVPFGLPPGLHQPRADSPSSQLSNRAASPDARLHNSSSRPNMQQEITYNAAASQSSAAVQSSKTAANRKTGQTDSGTSANSRSFADRIHQSSVSSASGLRERSPAGKRVARPELTSSRSDERTHVAHRRTASQPRSEGSQQRGKSPGSSSGRRRPRGDTIHGHSGSPANRSPSQGSDPYFDASSGGSSRGASGLRRKEGSGTPEMPVMTKDRLESLQREGRRSRKGSETGESRSRDRKERDKEKERGRDRDKERDQEREREKERIREWEREREREKEQERERERAKEKSQPPQLDALRLDLGGSSNLMSFGGDEGDGDGDKHQQQDRDPAAAAAGADRSGASKHARKDSKFRLSAPKFPAPLSPTFRGS